MVLANAAVRTFVHTPSKITKADRTIDLSGGESLRMLDQEVPYKASHVSVISSQDCPL